MPRARISQMLQHIHDIILFLQENILQPRKHSLTRITSFIKWNILTRWAFSHQKEYVLTRSEFSWSMEHSLNMGALDQVLKPNKCVLYWCDTISYIKTPLNNKSNTPHNHFKKHSTEKYLIFDSITATSYT